MRIGIDARMIGWTGIGRYTRALLDELQVLDHDNEYTVFLQGRDWNSWEPTAANFSKVLADFEPYSLGEQTGFSRSLKRTRLDLVHFLNFNSPAFYGGKRVTTVHDLTLVDYDTSRRGGAAKLVYNSKKQAMKAQLREALKRSAFIITDTEYVRHDLIGRGLAHSANTRAIPLGFSVPAVPEYKKDASPYPDSEILLYVGNYYPYKNIGRLIEAMPKILETQPKAKLVLAGKGDVYQAALRAQVIDLNLEDAVKFTGYITDAELQRLYRHAAAYVFPSLSEGFGLPGLEAMEHGLPVAAAQATCLPEVYGEAAVYFNPHDPSEIAETVTNLLSDSKLRAKLKKAGYERLKTFSWRQMAEQTLEVYRSATE